MSALAQSIRKLVQEYSAAFGASKEEMLLEAYYGTLILLCIFGTSALALAAFGK